MLPTIDEFRSDHERCSRRIARTFFISIGGMFAFVLLSLGASELFEAEIGPTLSKFLPGGLFAIGVPFMLFGFWWADQHHKKFPNLCCRHCGKSLVQSSGIVIASRNCPHCGRQVVAAPDEPT